MMDFHHQLFQSAITKHGQEGGFVYFSSTCDRGLPPMLMLKQSWVTCLQRNPTLTILVPMSPTTGSCRESLGRMSSGAISFRDLENDLASNPQRGYTVFYTHYVDVSLKLPQSPFLQSAVHGCEAMLSQFPPTALDRLNAFALLCEQCLVEPSLVVFTIWYSVTLMNTDPKRVLVSVRTGLSLVTGFSDRTHH